FESVIERTRAYVKIQDGCDNFCSYCIIPYLRGRSRSRQVASVVKETQELAQNCKEIVLTGIDISSFGKDINSSLADLLT
ncbi:MAG: radical SAM protein, partial [Clostridia bacterium]